MAYRFKLDEPIDRGFQRIGVEQIERAERQLNTVADTEKAIHETRKAMKRIRALLRLSRAGLKDKSYAATDAAFREVSHLLSETRDHDVLVAIVVKLEAGAARAALESVKRAIVARRPEVDCGIDTGPLAAARQQLAEARAMLEGLHIAPATFKTLRLGLERSHRHGRRALAAAYASPTDEAFHDLRKSTQRHWRQMQLLEPAWPEYAATRIAAARELAQILGEDHDLAMLKHVLKRIPREEIGAVDARLVRRAIRDRQRELRAIAEPRAQRLFAERPEELGRHMAALWSSARRLRARERREDVHQEAAPAEPAQRPRTKPASDTPIAA